MFFNRAQKHVFIPQLSPCTVCIPNCYVEAVGKIGVVLHVQLFVEFLQPPVLKDLVRVANILLHAHQLFLKKNALFLVFSWKPKSSVCFCVSTLIVNSDFLIRTACLMTYLIKIWAYGNDVILFFWNSRNMKIYLLLILIITK